MKEDVSLRTAMVDKHAGRILPVPRLSTILSWAVILFFIWAFFTQKTLQFYASFVFLFYALTKSMWVSVVLLGIFQTLLLVPFRIVNLIKSANLKEFEETLKRMRAEREQAGFLKQSVKGGRRVALYYMVNFFVQVISYISIGRLFLTDFYTKPLKPELLYSFVPYPEYPILDRMFKIPYIWFSGTRDLGMKWVLIAWAVIIGLQAALVLGRSLVKSVKSLQDSSQGQLIGRLGALMAGSTVILMVLAWIVFRGFPVGWEGRVFSGDVAYPNRTFNTITAIVTTVTLIWINIPKIRKKVELAQAAGMAKEVVWETEKLLFKETIQAAILVGLGAYFVTNLIPCAFELSVFTLEMISLLSPLTLDQVILGTVVAKESDKLQETSDKTIVNQEEETKVQLPETRKLEGEIKF